jgi:hypothetical protein
MSLEIGRYPYKLQLFYDNIDHTWILAGGLPYGRGRYRLAAI